MFNPVVDRDSSWAEGKGAGLSPEYHRDCDIREGQQEKNIYAMNDLILGYLGNFRHFGILGYFGHFKVNLGSGINFTFVTLNFSDQNF